MGLGNLTFANTTNQAFSGIISGTGGVTMAGSATQTLSGGNTFTGTVNINSGTLLLGAPDIINNSANMSLNGGTFATGGFSDTLNTLTLAADSTIDLGNGSSVLKFTDSSSVPWTSNTTLSITNWSGSLTGGGTDQIYFGVNSNGLNTSQLSQIIFVNPLGLISGNYAAKILSTGEIVPVPEPGVIAAAALLLTWLGWRERRRWQDVKRWWSRRNLTAPTTGARRSPPRFAGIPAQRGGIHGPPQGLGSKTWGWDRHHRASAPTPVASAHRAPPR
jgi:autotransporter-associated beta strand protein